MIRTDAALAVYWMVFIGALTLAASGDVWVAIWTALALPAALGALILVMWGAAFALVALDWLCDWIENAPPAPPR